MEAHQTPVEGLRRQSIQMLWKETSYEHEAYVDGCCRRALFAGRMRFRSGR